MQMEEEKEKHQREHDNISNTLFGFLIVHACKFKFPLHLGCSYLFFLSLSLAKDGNFSRIIDKNKYKTMKFLHLEVGKVSKAFFYLIDQYKYVFFPNSNMGSKFSKLQPPPPNIVTPLALGRLSSYISLFSLHDNRFMLINSKAQQSEQIVRMPSLTSVESPVIVFFNIAVECAQTKSCMCAHFPFNQKIFSWGLAGRVWDSALGIRQELTPVINL